MQARKAYQKIRNNYKRYKKYVKESKAEQSKEARKLHKDKLRKLGRKRLQQKQCYKEKERRNELRITDSYRQIKSAKIPISNIPNFFTPKHLHGYTIPRLCTLLMCSRSCVEH